jgi:flagellar basal body-associated protein FliL
MQKKLSILILIVLVIGLVMGGYYFWKIKKLEEMSKYQAVFSTEESLKNIETTVESIKDDVSKGLLPSMDNTAVNPMQDIPDTNPYEKTNPFSDIKVNPFE